MRDFSAEWVGVKERKKKEGRKRGEERAEERDEGELLGVKSQWN